MNHYASCAFRLHPESICLRIASQFAIRVDSYHRRHAMLRTTITLESIQAFVLGVLICCSFTTCLAQQTPPANKKLLQQAILEFPHGDYDSDGVLSPAEFGHYRRMQRQIKEQQQQLDQMPVRVLAEYAYGPHWRNTLDLWKAESKKPTPVLVFFHGGGFVGGDKSKYYGDRLANACLENGISVVSANYRYVTQASFPAPFLDAARVLQSIRHHAEEWGIDRNRIAATGSSAGGNLSAWFAVHDDLADADNPDPVLRESTRLTTIIAKNTQTSNDPLFWIENIYSGSSVHTSVFDFYGVDKMPFAELKGVMSKKMYRDMAVEASSLNHITDDDPPVFLIYPERLEEWDGKPLPPGTMQSKYAHHVAFGKFFKDAYDQRGLECKLKSQRDVTVDQEIDWLRNSFR